MPLEHLQLRIKYNISVKEAVLPYTDPVHFAIAEVDNLHPQYTQELRNMIDAKMSQNDEEFRGIRHEVPLTDVQWSQHVIVTKAHGCFEFLEGHITPWQLIQMMRIRD